MNSTLQCLCATTPFVSHFLRGHYSKDRDRNRSNPLGHGGVLADEFSFLMKSMWSGQYRFISPRDFKEAISRFAPTFSGSQQHDSQEFLAFLMDGLHEDMNRVTERRYIQNPDYSLYEDRKAASIAWALHKKRNDSIIVDLFQGQFRSTLHCLTCRHRSVNFEAFMYLSVPLPPGNSPASLKDCIKLFTKEERVSGTDKWYCSSCKQHRDASKRIEIWKLPAILLIHLKRFSYDGVWRQKKQNFVDFPFTGLDMSSVVVGTRDGHQEYRLFGVSNHFGTLTGGHCKCAIERLSQ
jgi:ubiquitin carboxyl-terminal hydrolase 8